MHLCKESIIFLCCPKSQGDLGGKGVKIMLFVYPGNVRLLDSTADVPILVILPLPSASRTTAFDPTYIMEMPVI